jgi:GDP-L-fucose synthase
MIEDRVINSFENRNVLITGGTGMIGSGVVHILCNAGANVRVVSLDDLIVDHRAAHVKADLTDISVCKDVTSGMDYVFHIAGIKGSIEVTKSKPASFLVPLLMFNTNVLEASRVNGVKKLVYTSSIGAYSSAEVFKEGENVDGAPMDMYPGWAKRMAELQIKAYREQYGLDWAVARPCNVYGPRDNFDPDNAMVIPSLMMRINRGENPVVVWGDGSAVRDFAFSRDVAEGIILAIYHGTRGDFINLGSGVGVTIKELVETLHRFLDFNYEFDTAKPSGFPKRVMDISRAREWIDYNPTTTLLDGLKETWAWFQKNQKEYLKRKNYFAEDEGY